MQQSPAQTSTSRNNPIRNSRVIHVGQSNPTQSGAITSNTTTPRKSNLNDRRGNANLDDRSTSASGISHASSSNRQKHAQNNSNVSPRNGKSHIPARANDLLAAGNYGVPMNSSDSSTKEKGRRFGRITVPLSFILIFQCMLVIIVFIILISVVTVKMTQTTRELVENRIASELRDSRHSIIEPITNYEDLLMAHRLRYISMSREIGRSLCDQKDGNFNASRLFWREALSSVYTHYPLLGWVYAIHLSEEFTVPETGDKRVNLCTASVDYMMCAVNGTLWTTTGPVTVDQTDTFEDVSFTVTPIDVRYDGYIVEALLHTDFGWWPYLWIEPSTGKNHLFIGGFAPMLINKTHANGTVESYIPDLSVPQTNKKDPNLTTVALINVDLMMTHVHQMVKDINPPAHGAHTSLYDLGTGTLLATSLDGVTLMVNNVMYQAGKGSSAELNRAYNAINPPKGTTAGDTTVRIVDDGDRILSSIHISTTSNIDFIIIQSTPKDFYFRNVVLLRTLMIALGVVSAIVIVVVCVAVVAIIRRSLSTIQEGMVLAAHLKNDRVKPVSSVMSELDQLCMSFMQMNEKLGAARAYMPQSMLLDTDTGGDEDENEDGNDDDNETVTTVSQHRPLEREPSATTNQADQNASPNRRKVKGAINTTSGVDSQLESGYHSSSVATGEHSHSKAGATNPNAGATALCTNMTIKRVTILVINTRGFHSRVNGDAASMGLFSAELTTTIQTIAAQQRGVIDSFHGDRYVVGFNAAKHNAQGPQQAVQCGLDIAAAFNNSNGMEDYFGDNLHEEVPYTKGGGGRKLKFRGVPIGRFTMGVASGKAHVGHLGSNDLKRFSIIGKVYSRAFALERACKQAAEEEAARSAAALRRRQYSQSRVVGGAHTSDSMTIDTNDQTPHTKPSLFLDNPIQLVVEDNLVEALEQSYFMQVVGVLRTTSCTSIGSNGAANSVPTTTLSCMMPFTSLASQSANAPAEESDEKSGSHRKSTSTRPAGDAIAPPKPQHVLVSSNGAAPQTLNSLVASLRCSQVPVDEVLVHCVRSSTKSSEDTTHDEWIYEVKQDMSGAYDTVLPLVNRALAQLLLPTSSFLRNTCSQTVTDAAQKESPAPLVVDSLTSPGAEQISVFTEVQGGNQPITPFCEQQRVAHFRRMLKGVTSVPESAVGESAKGAKWGRISLEFAKEVLSAIGVTAPNDVPAWDSEAIPIWLNFRVY